MKKKNILTITKSVQIGPETSVSGNTFTCSHHLQLSYIDIHCAYRTIWYDLVMDSYWTMCYHMCHMSWQNTWNTRNSQSITCFVALDIGGKICLCTIQSVQYKKCSVKKNLTLKKCIIMICLQIFNIRITIRIHKCNTFTHWFCFRKLNCI